jgi:hypothetical protein
VRRLFNGGRAGIGLDPGHHGLHCHRLALLHQDLGQDPGVGCRNLGIYLVSRDLEDRLVAFDRISHLLDPAGEGALRDRLAHLRHYDVYLGHRSFS